MAKYLLLLLFAVASSSTHAQVYKCKGADGKVQFADTACKAGSSSEIIPDRAPVSAQQQYEALRRARQMQDEAAALDDEKAAAQDAALARQRHVDAVDSRQADSPQAAGSDAEAVKSCVRDVERRGASQDVKAELIAACRAAPFVQRSTGIDGDLVTSCVRDVERSGATETTKARQLALCHGGAVPPEPEVIVVRPPVHRPPPVVKTCPHATCRDPFGSGHRKDDAGRLTSPSGQRCSVHGKTLACD